MTTQPAPDDANAAQPLSARPPSRLWQLAAPLFVVLLAVCAYWLVTLGPPAAFADPRFGYLGFAALILGACLIARWMMRPLFEGSLIDPRNAGLMRTLRSGWFLRQARGGGRGADHRAPPS